MLSPSLHLPIGGSPCVEVGKAVCYTESSDSPKEGGGEADESREKRIAERWWRLRGHQDDGEGGLLGLLGDLSLVERKES